jgi:hypothetical protein
MEAATEITAVINRVHEQAQLRTGFAEVLQKAGPKGMRKPLSHSIATREELVAIGKTALATAGVFRRVRVLLAAVQRFSNNANFVNMRSTKKQERHSKNVLRS